MDWRDEGILIAARRHGESSAIVEVFTAGHGRHAGVVRGGAGRRMTPVLQPGARLSVEWTARLEEHIGTFRVDPMPSRTAAIMADPAALAALGAVTALMSVTLPERDAHPRLYGRTLDLVRGAGRGGGLAGALCGLGAGAPLRARVRARPRALRGDGSGGGSGLGLAEVGAGGEPGGRGALGGAAAAAAGVPARGGRRRRARAEVLAGLALTGFFLEARVAPGLPREALPAARGRAVEAIRRA